MQLAKKNLRPHAWKYHKLNDGYVEALQESAEGEVKIGLRVRVGKRRVTWSFLKEHRIHGKRGVSFKRLGFFPAMDTKAARQAALIEAGRVASGRITPGRKAAIKFEAALSDYIAHARQRAEKKAKPPAGRATSSH